MDYDPDRPDREYHLVNLAQAKSDGAPWHRLADMYRNGVRNAASDDKLAVGRFVSEIGSRTGISAEDLIRMHATLERVELIAGRRRPEHFLSDDLVAVEAAARLAWHDPVLGHRVLRDLKNGDTTKLGVLGVLEMKEKATMSVPMPAAKTPHAHWSHFDENLEMLEFDRLHAILAHGDRVEPADYDRLVRLAHSSGYGEADGFIARRGLDGSEDDELAAAERELFEGYMDGDYWSQIDRSQNLMQNIGTEAARKAAQAICGAMRDAYERGRNLRIEQASQPAPAP